MMYSLMSRRGFFKRLGGLVLAAAPLMSPMPLLTSCGQDDSKDRRRKLIILHTNDVHSHIDPFPASDPRYAGLGGYARRETIICDTIRRYGAENVLVFESGDMFQGTPYFNFYHGKLEMQLMNRMHIDAVTIGNHEFDNGVSALCDCMEIANFPFLSANYTFTDPRGAELVKPPLPPRRPPPPPPPPPGPRRRPPARPGSALASGLPVLWPLQIVTLCVSPISSRLRRMW